MVLVAGSVVIEAALLAGSIPSSIVGTGLAGAGAGLVFGRGIGVTRQLANQERRADLIATSFVAAYLGSTVPTLGRGLLNQGIGTLWSTLILFAVIIAIAVLSMTLQLSGTDAQPDHRTPTSVPERA